MSETNYDFPSEIEDKLQSFHETVETIGNSIKPLLDNNLENEKMNPLDKARLYLTAAYAMNSLFWMNLITKGENPKEHPIKGEIDRIKMYMIRMKEIENKSKAPKLDKSAAKMFIRNSLWESSTQKSENQISNEVEQPFYLNENDLQSSPSPKRKMNVLEEKTKRKCIE